jgi:hypothetical protein
MNAERSKMRRFELLFDEPPTDRASGGIAERLRCQRVTRLMQAWQKHRQRELTFSPLSAGLKRQARWLPESVLLRRH